MSPASLITATLDMNAFALLSSVFVAWVVVTAIYRLCFHPLAKYPGPFWARLSSIPSYWHTLQCDRHIWLWRLQEQYGPSFRYQPNSILVNTPSAYHHIFGTKGNVKKGLYYQAWPRNTKALTTWNSTDIAMHSRKRRVLGYAFSDKALRSAELFVHSNVDEWIALMSQEIKPGQDWSGPLRMDNWTNWLVFDILGDLCFGRSFNMKKQDGDMREVPELLADMLKLMHPISCSPFAAPWVWLKPRGLDWLLAELAPPNLAKWNAFVQKCLEDRTDAEREAQGKQAAKDADFEVRKDFFHYLFHARDPETGKGFTVDELWGEAESLIIAGSDTTAVVLTALFFYLAHYPQVQEKLAQEILAIFPHVQDIVSGSKLQSCAYLRVVLQEVLRMTPPVSADPAREVLRGGTIVDGEFLAEGTNVSVGHYCLSFNKDFFPEPFVFKPERWIAEDESSGATEQSVALAEEAFCAFSTGSRGCVGKNLAWLELTIVVAKVIHAFEIRRDPKSNLGGGSADSKVGRRNPLQFQTYDAFVSLRQGPVVQLGHRRIY